MRRCDWNSKQFICRFHTYSLWTKSNGGSVAVDGSEYAALQSSFYNAATDLTDVLTVGSATARYKIKSVRLYSRQLTVAEAAQNAAEDEARFSIKPAADANGNVNAFDDAAFYFRSARQALNSYLDNFAKSKTENHSYGYECHEACTTLDELDLDSLVKTLGSIILLCNSVFSFNIFSSSE